MIDFTKHPRFWSKVNIGQPNDCWEFHTRKRGEDYGYFSIALRSVRAHRVAYQITYGSIPKGLNVCHHCDNKSCCNPNHLFLGNHSDNARDLVSKGLFHPKGTQIFGEANANSKLREDDVKTIRDSVKNGVKRKILAAQYGVTVSTIGDIVRKKNWSHIE